MLLSDKYCTFSVRIVCSSRSVITFLRATCNTVRRFSHAPVCPRLGHPPPSCSATPGKDPILQSDNKGQLKISTGNCSQCSNYPGGGVSHCSRGPPCIVIYGVEVSALSAPLPLLRFFSSTTDCSCCLWLLLQYRKLRV